MEQFTPQIFKRLSQRLDLTVEQKEKIRPIIRQADAEMRRLRLTGARDAIAVAENMHEQVAALLTPAQLKKLDDLKREMRERWARDRQQRWGDRSGPGGPPPPTPGERLTPALHEPTTSYQCRGVPGHFFSRAVNAGTVGSPPAGAGRSGAAHRARASSRPTRSR
jgi:hypothetical protein